MSAYKYIAYLLIVFLALVCGKAVVMTVMDGESQRSTALGAYPNKPYERLIEERQEMARNIAAAAKPEELAQALIQIDKWEGSANLYIRTVSKAPSSWAYRNIEVLKVQIEGLSELKNNGTYQFVHKYGNTLLSDEKYVALMWEHKQWEASIRPQLSMSQDVRQAWGMLLIHALWCVPIILFALVAAQGVMMPSAIRFAAYGSVAMFTVGGGATGIMPNAYAQATATVSKVKKEKKTKTTEDTEAKAEAKADETYVDPKITHAAIELLGSPQRGGGRVEIAPELGMNLGKVKGADVDIFTFGEFRNNPDFNFGQVGLTVGHHSWFGLKGVSSVGFSGSKAHGSYGAGIAIKESPLKKFVPKMDFVNVNYLHGHGVAAKNEVQIVYGSTPIHLTEKTRLVATGFYRIRALDSINDNYGQLQAQLTRTDFNKVAFVYEAETVGRSINHLFGIKLFLK